MSSPYWGQLPGPTIVKNRRASGDEGPAGSTSIDVPVPLNAPNLNAQLNRDSVQTNQTSNTGSTLSPLVSPTTSSFAPQGLAPRPPSYQRPPPGAESDAGPSTRNPRRRSRNSRQIDNDPSLYQSLEASLEAQEQSRAPPVSYRNPLGNGAPASSRNPTTTSSGKTVQLAKPSAKGKEMDYGEPYTSRHEGPYQSYGDTGGPPIPGSVDHSRKASVSTTERRRKSAMSNKSPLQRLELTLDSMTKEEKRARVEAAERRARERHARKATEEIPQVSQVPVYQPVSSQPVSAHTRRPSASYGEPRPSQVYAAPPMPREEPIHMDAPVHTELPPSSIPVRRHTQVEDRSYHAPAPRTREPVQQPVATDPAGDLPKRNLSFRERAARDEIALPFEEERIPQSRQAPTNESGGFSLTRSGSNKLKKSPPRELSYQTPEPAPEEYEVSPVSDVHPPLAQAPTRGALPQRARDKELPPSPHESPRMAAIVGSRRGHFSDDIEPVQRRATEPVRRVQLSQHDQYIPPAQHTGPVKQVQMSSPYVAPQTGAQQRRKLERQDSDNSSDSSDQHRISGMLYKGKEDMSPGNGLYNPPQWLDEWKKAPTGSLAGTLLTMTKDKAPPAPSRDEQNKTWWEGGSRRSSYSYEARPSKAETRASAYDDLNAPTRFKPQLYLECGPLLRYTGIRQEKVPTRTRGVVADKEFWRGSIMIVTRDSDSSTEIVPMLHFFVQALDVLPTPPHHVDGDLSPEYVDPIAGHPKTGRRGETLFVRPVEQLEEGKDLSQHLIDEGLFETQRSVGDYAGSFASRLKRANTDGEKLAKYRDVKGFRLHAEHGCTFWRFNIEVELKDQQQRIAYRINRGPCNGFWVPRRGTSMNIMFHSCNGFNVGSKADAMSGPDPMWRDVLNNHQSKPFHVMVGGGDQIFNDEVAEECNLFIDWLEIRNPLRKRNAPFTPELQAQLEGFYFKKYCTWFSRGLFGLANSQIPMVNIWSDRESFNGFGSYPHEDMNSPVLSGVGSVAFKYYMLFQHQSIIPETDTTEPSWILGSEPGPYVNELSRSVYVSLGSKLALLAADCRTERTEDDVIDDKTWDKIMTRMYSEVRRGQVEHLLVVFPVPIAYPRLAWIETLFGSKAMNPVKALSKRGLLGKAMGKIDGGSEVMDDLKDHWTAKNHQHERSIVVEDLQDLAIDKSLRITVLSGDVNMAAVGQFYSNPKLGIPKHKDPRYMPNIISSAIANAPPPDIMADAINRRHKVHHFDTQTDESMIPIFQHGVDGKPRNNKRLLPHRNWCSIRQWEPGSTPPPTPPPIEDSPSPERSGSVRGGILRRLSLSGSKDRPDMSRESVRGPRPPVTGGGGGLFRRLSNSLSRRNSTDGDRPKLTRTMSLERGGSDQNAEKRGFFSFGRRNSQKRPDDGGINGQWGAESEDDYDDYPDPRVPGRPHPMGLRGGAAHDEYSDGDDSYFVARPPQRSATLGSQPASTTRASEDIPPQALRPFHRTPTGLSVKQMRKADDHAVDLEGGLDVCINVEVNPRDPTGITVPYRMLVPKLFYEYTPGVDEIPAPAPVKEEQPGAFKRLLSFRKKEKDVPPPPPTRAEVEDREAEERYEDELEDRYLAQRY